MTRLPVIAVTLPDGAVIQAELAATPAQQARGLMFRDELPADRGMIFHFLDMRQRPFWMYNTRIPLDMIWMDSRGYVVEIVADTPPCESQVRQECPHYGGRLPAKYILELAAGQAAAHGVEVGARIGF